MIFKRLINLFIFQVVIDLGCCEHVRGKSLVVTSLSARYNRGRCLRSPLPLHNAHTGHNGCMVASILGVGTLCTEYTGMKLADEWSMDNLNKCRY